MTGLFAIFDKGDFSFGSPRHHGTPKERGKAFLAGYRQYRDNTDPSNVYRFGLDFVDRMKSW